MSLEFLAGEEQARGAMLRTVEKTSKQMAGVYRQAYQDLAAKAGKQASGSLTQRWQQSMSESLNERMHQLNGEATAVISTSMQSAGQLPGKATADWLDMVISRAGAKGAGDAYRSVLTRTSDEAMRQVLSGAAYLDSKALSKRIWKTTKRARDGINAVLQQGIAQKKSAYELAKDLEKFVKRNARQDYDWTKVYPDIPYWLQPISVEKHAQTLARTSINHAFYLAMVAAAEQNPFATCIHWQLSPQHYERQTLPNGADVCDEYAYHDEGLGLGNFPINAVPMPHPNCLCSQYAVVPQTLAQCADDLRRLLDGEVNHALQGNFLNWGDLLGRMGAGTAGQGSATKQSAVIDKKPQDVRSEMMNWSIL